MKLLWVIVGILLVCVPPLCCAQAEGESTYSPVVEDPEQLRKLKEEFKIAIERLEDPLRSLEAKYRESLETLARDLQKKGKLEDLLVVKKEIATFRDGKDPESGELEELQRLRNIYDREVLRLREEMAPRKVDVQEKYLRLLDDAKKEATRLGNFDLAVLFDQEYRRMNEDLGRREDAPKQLLEEPDWMMTSRADYEMKGEVILDKQSDGAVLMTKGRGTNVWIATDRNFKPPFRIEMELRPTAPSDVRIVYCDRFLAKFNTGDNKDSAVILSPFGKQLEFPGKGKLSETDYNKIELVVNSDGLDLSLNGVACGTMRDDFGNDDGTVAISPFRDCPVVVKRFAIYKVGEK